MMTKSYENIIVRIISNLFERIEKKLCISEKNENHLFSASLGHRMEIRTLCSLHGIYQRRLYSAHSTQSGSNARHVLLQAQEANRTLEEEDRFGAFEQ